MFLTCIEIAMESALRDSTSLHDHPPQLFFSRMTSFERSRRNEAGVLSGALGAGISRGHTRIAEQRLSRYSDGTWKTYNLNGRTS